MMKRIALITVFFYACTFAAPPRSQAVVPALWIAASVGAAMVTTSAGTYYAQNGTMPQYVTTASNAVASAADMIFQPSYLAQGVYSLFTPDSLNTAKDYYIGKAAAVGATVGDIIDQVQSSASGMYQDLKNLLETATLPAEVNPSDFNIGTVLEFTDGSKAEVVEAPTASGWKTMANWVSTTSSFQQCTQSTLIKKNGNYLYILNLNEASTNSYGAIIYRMYMGRVEVCVLDPNYNPPGGFDYGVLKDSLSSPTTAEAEDLRDVIKALPPAAVTAAGSVPATTSELDPSPTLSAAEIAQILQANAAAVAQAAATAAQDIVNENADNAAAQIAALQSAVTAAQAAADAANQEATQENEETFSPISDNPFQTAYNPGEYDIPTRFTSFLTNVKSSGLFSFSSDFFNSLPTGGSSLYTIDGGNTYGTHTIDLNDTLSPGLAVLKAVLLACFGFLSIRAVIMKR